MSLWWRIRQSTHRTGEEESERPNPGGQLVQSANGDDDGDQKAASLKRRPWLIRGFLLVIIVVIGAIAINININLDLNEVLRDRRTDAEGRIESPTDGAVVEEDFTVEVFINRIPDDGHVWLAVQRRELTWPKTEIPAQDSVWVGNVCESGTSAEPFSLVLFWVRSVGQDSIQAWLKQADFPGLKVIPEKDILAAVQLSVR